MPRLCCPRCARPLSHCLCALVPRLSSRTRVLVLQHPAEASHALNTARLAALALDNGELRIGETFPELAAELAHDTYRSCLLFPGTQAMPLAELVQDGRPLRLIVPDGTWRKARRILHLNPSLAALPRVALPEG